MKLCKGIGTTGFEPATYCSQSSRATKLRHVPVGYSIYHEGVVKGGTVEDRRNVPKCRRAADSPMITVDAWRRPYINGRVQRAPTVTRARATRSYICLGDEVGGFFGVGGGAGGTGFAGFTLAGGGPAGFACEAAFFAASFCPAGAGAVV